MSDPTIAAWSRENDLLFQLRRLREENERLRKPLRDHEIAKILDCERMKWHKSPPTYEFDLAFARAIEAAHGIKENT